MNNAFATAFGSPGSAGGNSFLSGATNAISMPINALFEGISSNIFGNMTARTNANNYNKYQDITYPRDTARMLDRMDTLFPGTNPWERLGTGSASPLPSPAMEGNERAGQSALPLQLAKMNNDTQLRIAEMQTGAAKEIAGGTNQTTRDVTEQNNATARAIAEYAQTGPEAVQRTAKAAADTILSSVQAVNTEALTAKLRAETSFIGQATKESDSRIRSMEVDNELKRVQGEILKSDDLRRSLMTLADLIPRETWTTPGYERSGLAQADPLINLAKVLAEASGAQKFERGDAYMRSLSPHDLNELQKAGLAAAGAIKSGMDIVGGASKAALDNAKRLTPSEY